MAFISDDNIIIDTSHVVSVVKGTFTDSGYLHIYQTLEIFLNVGTVVKVQYVKLEERDSIFDKIKEQLIETNFRVKN